MEQSHLFQKVNLLQVELGLKIRSWIKIHQNSSRENWGSKNIICIKGKQFQSWIHIEDVSAIFLFISKNKLLGNFNAVAPNPITKLEMVNTTKNQLYDVLLNKNFETFTGKRFT